MPTIMTDSTTGLTQKDTTFTKIFVGGLPYHTTDKSLREHFEAFGEIEEAVVITDRQTMKSRGYGFVTMGDRLAAERACKDANPIIDGRKANVNLAYIGAKPRGNTAHGLPLPLRTSYPSIPGQYGLPPSYIYPSPFVTSAAGLIPLPHAASISPAAAAAAAAAVAAANPFYDYLPSYNHLSQFAAATNGFDATFSSPYSSPSSAAVAAAAAAAAAGYGVAPGGYAYSLPQAHLTAAGGSGGGGSNGAATTPTHFAGLQAYGPQAQLQETRMQ